jgi:hypothetical protein
LHSRPNPHQVCGIEVAKGYGAAEWRDDLKRVLKRAGLEGRDCVFLLADTQIIQEGFLEDVNNILNAGKERPRLGFSDAQVFAEDGIAGCGYSWALRVKPVQGVCVARAVAGDPAKVDTRRRRA